jgi:2-phosphosulfolactate phosphatase
MLLPLNHKVHVLFRRQDLDTVKLEGKVVVVLDVLFATSTMITALAHGAAEVVPALDGDSARAAAQRLRAGSYVLSGELLAETIDGFAPPTPLALLAHGLRGKTLIYSTTNGTVALRESSTADHVYAGALLNANAVVKHIAAHHRDAAVLIICSGSMGNPNLEDMYGGGYFVELIARELGEGRDFSDAAIAARALFQSEGAESALLRGRVGQLMQQRGLTQEVKYAAQLSLLGVVPKLFDGVLRAV